jgi:alkanesulfonate monooxygenase SsuD/methylene tetrahydromethanopterin reductase-like flavin-dependent oxidoreductase (luciferase family)
LLAKTAGTPGMIIHGLGAGDSGNEHERFGYAFDHRVSGLEETLIIVGQLLRTGAVTSRAPTVNSPGPLVRPSERLRRQRCASAWPVPKSTSLLG